jgi:hypothetical protein
MDIGRAGSSSRQEIKLLRFITHITFLLLRFAFGSSFSSFREGGSVVD